MPKKPPKRTDHELELLRLLGIRFRRLRGYNILTNEELAEKADLNPRNLAAMQAGEVNVRYTTLARIKKALGLESWDELLPDWDDVDMSKRTKVAKKAIKKSAKKTAKKSTQKRSKQS